MKESEERYRRLLETAKDGMLILDGGTGEIKDANPYLLNLLGYEKEELIGKRLWGIQPFKDIAENKKEFMELKEEGHVRHDHLPLETKGGEEVSVEFDSTTYKAGGEEVIQCNIRDISQRVEKSEELRERSEELEELLEGMNDAVFVHDLEGNFVAVNQEAVNRLGYSEEELLEMTPRDIDAPEHRGKVEERIEDIEEGETLVFETEHITKEGNRIPVEISSSQITYKGEPTILSVARDITKRKEMKRRQELFTSSVDQASLEVYWINSGGEFEYTNQTVRNRLGYSRDELEGMPVWEIDPNYSKEDWKKQWEELKEKNVLRFESKHQTKHGKTYPVEITSHYMQKGGKKFEFAFANNITERKESEKRKKFLHSLLRHDVQNKNEVIEGYLELLKEKEDLGEEVKEEVNEALNAVSESEQIIEKVRALRELEEEEIKTMEIKPVLEDVIEENHSIAEKKDIKIRCEKCPCEVMGGPLLKELFSNLVENSLRHSDGSELKIHGQERDDECIVTIEDDGKGIPDEEKQKVFEKGYKCGETGGTGLGLYLVKEIAESYGGSIEVKDSELGGARFDVYLQKP